MMLYAMRNRYYVETGNAFSQNNLDTSPVGTDLSRPCWRFDCPKGRDKSVPTYHTMY